MRSTPGQREQERAVPSSAPQDAIREWLAVFARTLAVPAPQAREIVEELEDHLRTRVHDLMIGGASEPEAISKAIAELGETVRLAQQFRASTRSRRRQQIMQILTMTGAAAAVAISFVALNMPGGGHAPGTAPPQQAEAGQEADVALGGGGGAAVAEAGDAAPTSFLDMPGVLAREDEPRVTYSRDLDELIEQYGPIADASTRSSQAAQGAARGAMFGRGGMPVPPGARGTGRGQTAAGEDRLPGGRLANRVVLLHDIAASIGLEVRYLEVDADEFVPRASPLAFESSYKIDDRPLADVLDPLFGFTGGSRGDGTSSVDYDYRVREGVLEITYEGGFEVADAVVRRYDSGPYLRSEYVADVIRTFVRPEIWGRQKSGPPSMHTTGILMIHASPWVHAEIEPLVKELRDAKAAEFAQFEREDREQEDEVEQERRDALEMLRLELQVVGEQLAEQRAQVVMQQDKAGILRDAGVHLEGHDEHADYVDAVKAYQRALVEVSQIEAAQERVLAKMYLLEVGSPPSVAVREVDGEPTDD